MSRIWVRRPITLAAAVAMGLSMASCASTGDLLGSFAGRAGQLGYDTCEQRDLPPEEETVEAMFICSADAEHGVMLLVFDTTIARETWTDEYRPAYDDSGSDLIGHDRWVIAGNDFDHVKDLAKGMGAPLASN